MKVSEDLRRAVLSIIKAGYQLDKEAFEYLKTLPDSFDIDDLVINVIKEIEKLPSKPFFINRSLLENKTKEILRETEREKAPSYHPTLTTLKRYYRPYAKDVESDIKIVEDPTDNLQTTGSLKDYIKYFQDRFKRIQRLFRMRRDVKNSITISEVLKSPNNSKAKIICMISEKRESKRGIFLKVEDLEANATIYVPSGRDPKVVEKAQRLLLDQVVCACVVKGRNELLIAEDFIFPEIPVRKPNKAKIPVYAALISDLHLGSKMFMKREFQRFILWLNGKIGNPNSNRIASHVKYVVIAGDLVDGVGIYPQQMKELDIKDIYEQYKATARMIEQIPDYIEVIIIPGNHDASRRALPQPAIPEKYAEPLYEGRKIYSLGNPSTINLHNVEILLYHGRSLDDVISLVPNMSFQSPEKAMKFLLQSRHLAPTYGQRTPIASEKRDFLVIERVPDIFHAGHVHMFSYETYRGVLLLNSGAWQRQTEYQREMGHVPNPGIVPAVNLQTLEVMPIDFVSLS